MAVRLQKCCIVTSCFSNYLCSKHVANYVQHGIANEIFGQHKGQDRHYMLNYDTSNSSGLIWLLMT
jgi:hypothetical protein